MSAIEDKEIITVHDRLGFHYEVTIDHSPQFGFSTAYYQGRIIGQVEFGGRLYKPMSDDDREWEEYQERYAEWRDEIKTQMHYVCAEHFNRELQQHG